jgi:hypothetical protein
MHMLLKKDHKSREKRKRIAHIIAGFVILVHAFEKYESHHASYIFFAVAGLVFITIAALHPVIEKKAPWIDGVFFVIESLLSFFIAYDYFHLGKKGLPFCYIAIGIFQLVIAFVQSKKGVQRHKAAHQV